MKGKGTLTLEVAKVHNNICFFFFKISHPHIFSKKSTPYLKQVVLLSFVDWYLLVIIELYILILEKN